MTEKYYYLDPYKKEIKAKVISEGEYVEFDKTIFFVGGGGQDFDTGYANEFVVSEVYEKNGHIYHKISRNDFKVGDIVSLKLNYEKRLDDMQQHLGEHILAGLLKKHFDIDNVGFHIGKEYVTMDINKEISIKDLEFIEDMANEVIYKNIEVKFLMYKSKDEAGKLRKDTAVKGEVRVVEIKGVDKIYCCGTHPFHTGVVGAIKIIKIKKNKKNYRLFFICGKRALKDYRNKNKIVGELNNKLSSDDNTLLSKFDTLNNQKKEIKNSYNELRKKYLDILVEKNVNTKEGHLIIYIKDLSEFDIKHILKCMRNIQITIVLYSSESVYITKNINSNIKNYIKKYELDIKGSEDIIRFNYDKSFEIDKFIKKLEEEIRREYV